MAGALLAMGAQTFTLFVGYGVAGAAYGQLQAGSIVGPVGAILLFVGAAGLWNSFDANRYLSVGMWRTIPIIRAFRSRVRTALVVR